MLEKLNKLVGKSFDYRGKTIVITKVKYVGTSFVVFTNRQTMNFFENEVDEFISELKEPVLKPIKIFNKMDEEKKETTTLSVTTNIKQTLLDTLDKVKYDKGYINQANAICNITSQMINVMKVEIQILNLKK